MKINESLLNDKVMQLLKTYPACSDARSVMLELIDGTEADANWRIGHFDPGRGDRYACKVALRRIHDTLRHDYEMVGYS